MLVGLLFYVYWCGLDRPNISMNFTGQARLLPAATALGGRGDSAWRPRRQRSANLTAGTSRKASSGICCFSIVLVPLVAERVLIFTPPSLYHQSESVVTFGQLELGLLHLWSYRLHFINVS